MIVVFVADHRRWCDFIARPDVPRANRVWGCMADLSDANIAAQNMVIAAESFGLGSCYIGDIIEHERVKALPAG
ncbi:MAG: nitroreductase family protein [Merdibacter sp.]